MNRGCMLLQGEGKEVVGATNPVFPGEVAVAGALGGSLHRKESYVGRWHPAHEKPHNPGCRYVPYGQYPARPGEEGGLPGG